MTNKRKTHAGQLNKHKQYPRPKPKPKPVEPGNTQANATGPSPNLSDKLDAGHVHYASSSDDEMQPSESVKRRKPAKKFNAKNSDSDDMSMSEDDGQAEINLAAPTEGGESDVEVTLDFHDPRPDDVQPVALYLNQWTQIVSAGKSDGLSVAAVAETVCAQTRVGTTIRVEHEDSPIGFVTCLNVRRHAKVFQPLFKLLYSRCREKEAGFLKLLKACVEGKGRFEHEKMGLLLCERVVNLPPMVLPKVLEAVFSEVEWAVEDEPTEELREDFRLGWYLVVTEVYVRKDEAEIKDAGATKKKSKERSKDTDIEDGKMSFAKAEDQVWFKYATQVVTWPYPGADVEKGGMSRKGMAMIISAKNIPIVRKMVTDIVGFVEEGEGKDDTEDARAKS